MKTLSGTFTVVVLTVIVVVTLIGCRPKHALDSQKFTLRIGEYAEVPDEDDFKKALKTLKDKGGLCEITFLHKEGEQPDKDYCKKLDLGLKTDKVTKSEVANSAAVGESTAHDPRATYKVTSADPKDIIEVLKKLK